MSGVQSTTQGQFRHVIEGTAGRGQGGADVEVALLDLGSEVAFADRETVGVPGNLPGDEDQLACAAVAPTAPAAAPADNATKFRRLIPTTHSLLISPIRSATRLTRRVPGIGEVQQMVDDDTG
ncbi:hypothetical protein ADL29_12335 [Streptomyces chattanoogensis]|uniref:Uncharacterized protein n=1 Tax=Streptomyces chattanoogensis TaxID=66876 RepID=A0A0N0XWS6_9ACTN|nr:hypothetical protein ADL29_12335 [Streptomyces chattanoogensis]